MDAVSPKCPSCAAPVQPDWDWCQLCGYDPEELMPVGWIPPQLYQLEAAGDTVTATRRRRSKRGRAAKAADEPVAPPLIQLPENLTPAVDPITAERAVVADPPSSTGQAQPPAPATPAEPIRADSPAMPAAPPPRARDANSRGHKSRGDKARGAKGAARSTAAVVAAPGKPTVYRVGATPPEVIGAGILLLAAAVLAYLTVRGILQVATGASTSVLDNVATVVFVVICAVVAFAAAAQGLALVRQRVELHDHELVAHNRFGRVQRVPLEEIYAIRLSQRQFATPRGLSQAIETPYLQRGDGTGFWLDALGGRSPGASPSDEQLALFEQLTAAVDRRRPPRPTL